MSAISATTIPLSRFVEGAQEVFEEVRRTGAKLITNGQEKPCVMMTAEEYMQLVDDLADRELELLAAERLAHPDKGKWYTMEEVMAEFGITEQDLEAIGDVEIE